jgi:hypothetical protein
MIYQEIYYKNDFSLKIRKSTIFIINRKGRKLMKTIFMRKNSLMGFGSIKKLTTLNITLVLT